jgi:hypothetical protein
VGLKDAVIGYTLVVNVCDDHCTPAGQQTLQLVRYLLFVMEFVVRGGARIWWGDVNYTPVFGERKGEWES